MRNCIYSITLEEAFGIVGGHHKYQQRLLLVLCGVLFSNMLFLQSIVFILLPPELECKNAYGDWEPCTKEKACASDQHMLDPDSDKSIPFDFELVCSHEFEISLIETLALIGSAIGAFVCSQLSNTYGRVKMLYYCEGIMIGSLVVSLASLTETMFNVTILFSGFAFGGIEIICFVQLSEFIDSSYRNYYLGALNSSSGVAMLFASVNSWVLYQWKFITLANIVIIAVAVIPIYILDESPRYLASVKGKYRQAKQVLQKVALFNKREKFQGLLEGEKVIGYHEGTQSTASTLPEKKSLFSYVNAASGIIGVSEAELKNVKKYTFTDLCRNESIRGLWIVSMMVWFCLNLSYFTIQFNLPNYMENVFLNAVLLGIADVCACLISILLINQAGRQTSLVMFLAVGGITSLISVAFSGGCSKEYTCNLNGEVQSLMLMCARFSTTASIYVLFVMTSEIFPTVIRDIAFGSCSAAARFGGLISPALIALGQGTNLNSIFVVSIFLIVCAFLACGLPEPLGLEMNDYLNEEQEEMKMPAELSQVNFVAASRSSIPEPIQEEENEDEEDEEDEKMLAERYNLHIAK